ncbi:hypothetical protein [Streptomyces eurythermus]|uniref:hypothetical protein n=1 Tax=Streptomyces eurythermus TaxID=42237 RepID=UPI00340B4E87
MDSRASGRRLRQRRIVEAHSPQDPQGRRAAGPQDLSDEAPRRVPKQACARSLAGQQPAAPVITGSRTPHPAITTSPGGRTTVPLHDIPAAHIPDHGG